MWKKVLITEFEILLWYLPGEIKETHEIPQPESWFQALQNMKQKTIVSIT
jgi:hypothetical protein